jgi:CTD kinase subunit gamma CTK3
MADPFELRLAFSGLLRAFNPCDADSGGTDDAILLCMKHRDTMDEDFHAVILEQLRHRDNNINVRANIVYFLEDLVDAAKRDKYYNYVKMIERDWGQVVDAAIPLEGVDGLGIVNANAVRYVTQTLHYEHGLWRETSSSGHGTMEKSSGELERGFEYWKEYVEKRAKEARPELKEWISGDEEEEEVDMSWVHGVVAMEVDSNKVVADVGTHVDETRASLADIKSPPGSKPISPNVVEVDMSTPKPPTPIQPDAGESNGATDSAYSPTRKFSPMDMGVPTESKTTAITLPKPQTPTYTPVQREDAAVFQPENFELIQQRLEQDRERQRRKEDNSGFVRTGNIDEEIEHVMMTGRKYVGGQVEREAWKHEADMWREARSFA